MCLIVLQNIFMYTLLNTVLHLLCLDAMQSESGDIFKSCVFVESEQIDLCATQLSNEGTLCYALRKSSQEE